MRDAEVVIVGAGPAGSALASMLGEAGVATILVDRSTFPRDKPCGEGLMPAGVEVLEGLGIALDSFPALSGVTYRVPGAGSAVGGIERSGFQHTLLPVSKRKRATRVLPPRPVCPFT